MKRIISVILAVALLCFCAVSVSAKSVSHSVENVNFKLSSGYTLLTDEDLVASSTVEGLLFAAISNDEAHQIQCRSTVTDFSKDLKTFSGLLGEDLAPVGQMLFPDGYDTAEIGNHVYLKSSSVTDGKYSVIYVTVSDGRLYTFSYFGSDPTEIGQFMGNVTLPDSATEGGTSVVLIAVLALAIAAVSAVIVLIALSFLKDYRHRKMEKSENIVSNYIKIKRRKY